MILGPLVTLAYLETRIKPDYTRSDRIFNFSRISLPNSKRIKIESIFTSPVIFNFSICGHVKLENFYLRAELSADSEKKLTIIDKMLFLGNLLSSKFNLHEIDENR